MSKIIKNSISIICQCEVFLCIVYKLLFEVLYINYFSFYWNYLGVILNINYSKCILSWSFFIFFLLLKICLKKTKLTFVFNLFFYFSIIPTLSVYWLKNESSYAFFSIIFFWSVWLFFTYYFNNYLEKDSNIRNRLVKSAKYDYSLASVLNPKIITVIFLYAIVSSMYFSLKYGDGRIFIKFSDVYKYRLKSGNSMTTLGAYVFSWNVNIIIPLCLIYHLIRKKYVFALLDVFLFFINYAIYGNKVILITCAAIICIWIIYLLNNLHNLDTLFIAFIVFIMLLSIIVKKTMLFALIDRLIEIPSSAHYYYYDFFQTNELLLLRQSCFKLFFNDPYDLPVSVIIGSSPVYMSGKYNNLNNGLFSDAYSNFGIIGCLILPFLINYSFYVLSKYFQSLDECIQYSFLFIFSFYILSANFFSWLLTGGVFVLMILLFVLNKKKVARLILGLIT